MSDNPNGTFDGAASGNEGGAPTPPPAPQVPPRPPLPGDAPTAPYATPLDPGEAAPAASDAPTAPYAAPQVPGDAPTSGELVPAVYAPPPAPAYDQPYAAPVSYAAPMKRANGLAIAGFVVGLVSVFLPLIFGLIGGGVGLTLSIIGVAKHDDAVQSAKGLGIAGIVLSAVAIVFIL